jgi:hypothetical protein
MMTQPGRGHPTLIIGLLMVLIAACTTIADSGPTQDASASPSVGAQGTAAAPSPTGPGAPSTAQASCQAVTSSPPARLADEGWTIERFAAQLDVRGDASLRVTETIEVDFGPVQKHGILRQIQVRYCYDDTHDRVYDLTLRTVTDERGASWPFERGEQARNVVIKIGAADRTVSGRQTYRIAYDVAGALNALGDRDELYWNVNGEWPVRTVMAEAHVQLERGMLTQAWCFQGQAASQENCRSTIRIGRADISATRTLGVGEHMTVVATFAKGLIAEPRVRLDARRP